jgi:hypothetical protein
MHRRSRIVTNIAPELCKIPGLQRITACCAAPGIRPETTRPISSGNFIACAPTRPFFPDAVQRVSDAPQIRDRYEHRA